MTFPNVAPEFETFFEPTRIWLFGKPLVVLTLLLIGLLLWRDSVRLGPLAAAPTRARRSLAEQIRGTGQFALRYGGGEALHAASARARRRAVSAATGSGRPK